MPDWFPLLRRRSGRGARAAPVLELLVLEGADAGRQFTIDSAETRIGRGAPAASERGQILLGDASLAAEQALLRSCEEGLVLEHRPGAEPPTCVNGRPIDRHVLVPGDRIEMGRVRLEVRARDGLTLSGLFEQPASAAAGTAALGATTELRPMPSAGWQLRVLRGLEPQSFPVRLGETRIGRSADCEVHLPGPRGISRLHAKLVWQGAELVLLHYSRVNPTLVNGEPVTDRRALEAGDEIQLADQVVLRLECMDDEARSSLATQLEARIELDRRLAERFEVRGSFLDVDVAGSYAMKARSAHPDRIIVSFDRWRGFLRGVVEEFGGQVLNSNGDELMCFFAAPLAAVRAASASLRRLPAFNHAQNLLELPFRMRLGIHTGESLVDLERGVAYSTVLDVAGHLQKQAEVDGCLISEATLRELPAGLPFEPAGKLEREGLATFRLAGDVG